MAALPTEDRARIWRGLQRYWSAGREAVGVLKGDLLAAVGAADDWVEANQAGYNSALPAAARSGMTTGQKSLLLCAVLLMRYNLALLKQVFGEVD